MTKEKPQRYCMRHGLPVKGDVPFSRRCVACAGYVDAVDPTVKPHVARMIRQRCIRELNFISKFGGLKPAQMRVLTAVNLYEQSLKNG